MFSQGNATDGKSKTEDFGLLNMAVMEETKSEPQKSQGDDSKDFSPLADQVKPASIHSVNSDMIKKCPERTAKEISVEGSNLDVTQETISSKLGEASSKDILSASEQSIKAESQSTDFPPQHIKDEHLKDFLKEEQPQPSEPKKSVIDSSAEAVTGFMSKIFSGTSSATMSSPGPGPHQQNISLFAFSSNIPKNDLLSIFKPEAPKTTDIAPPVTSAPQSLQSVQDQMAHNDSLSSSMDSTLCESKKNIIDKNELLKETPANDTSFSNSTLAVDSASCQPSETDVKESMYEVMHDKTISKDKSIPAIDSSPNIIQQAPTSEPQSIFSMPGLTVPKFGFMSGPADVGKSFGSFFSSPPTIPNTEGKLLSGLKSFSAGLLQEEKPVASNEPPTSLFGTKLGFPWQKETPTPNQQTPHIVTTQPKANESKVDIKDNNAQTRHGYLISKDENCGITQPSDIKQDIVANSEKNSDTDIQKEIVVLANGTDKPQTSASTPDLPFQKQLEIHIQTPFSIDVSSGLQQEMDLLIPKRLVEA